MVAALTPLAHHVYMDLLIAVLTVLGAVVIGAISPGPSFVLVARTAIAVSRRDGIAAAVGMGFGAFVFAGAALLGLNVVLTTVPWVYLGIKIAGAAYLFYLALHLWKGAGEPLATATIADDRTSGVLRSLAFGLATQLSNPKTAIWYASIFTAVLSVTEPQGFAAFVLPMIFAVETGWYVAVAITFSAPAPRRSYLRLKLWIDRIAGGVMALLGLKLIWETR
jgi:threonine/homoserine/homoserine lactone efflux protein